MPTELQLPEGSFRWAVDGLIIFVYLSVTVAAGLMVRRYVKGVEDFLVAGRKVNLHLGIASLAATEFGIATCIGNAQLGFKYGFAGITPGIALFAAMYIVGRTGFCIERLRQSGALTVAEMFERQFGMGVRQLSGIVMVLGGLLNMGVFLRQAGDFLVVVCGLPPNLLEITMTALLLGVVVYTILGGMLSVLVTDFIQFVVMSIGLLTVTGLIFWLVGWSGLTESVAERIGPSGFNPFAADADGVALYGVPRILFDVFVAFAAVLTWQSIISRLLSAKDEHTGKKIYTGTAAFFLVRFTIPVLWGIAAAVLLKPELLTSLVEADGTAMIMPVMLKVVLPTGILGLLIAAMLAADMSTNSSYMLAWSSIIFNDVLRPFKWINREGKSGLRLNRMLIALIGVFLLLYGLWYPLKGDLWVYLQLTGTVYLSSMSVLLISACYWKRANARGAIAAIVVGAIVPVGYLVAQQVEAAQAMASFIGPYWSGISTYLLAAIAMVLGSLSKPPSSPNR